MVGGKRVENWDSEQSREYSIKCERAMSYVSSLE